MKRLKLPSVRISRAPGTQTETRSFYSGLIVTLVQSAVNHVAEERRKAEEAERRRLQQEQLAQRRPPAGLD
jgi:hypothetical protein